MSTPYYSDSTITVHHQPEDGFSVLASLPDNSIDAVVTDPPYLLGFMGRQWDSHREIDWHNEWTAEALRVLKPGGHLLAFGGTRTWHRLACAVEDAGFEVRDSIAWMYGSGFPKSLDVSKAIDKQRHDRADVKRVTAWVASVRTAAGVTNRDIDAAFGFNGMAGHWTTQGPQASIPTLDQVPTLLKALRLDAADVPDGIRALLIDLNGMKGQPGPAWFAREVTGSRTNGAGNGSVVGLGSARSMATAFDETAPATEAARTWQGWGTALKPAFEPIVVARKPLIGTVAANVLQHGTGALNIDGCRAEGQPRTTHADVNRRTATGGPTMREGLGLHDDPWPAPAGRWPANVILDESQAEALDEQSGTLTSGNVAGSTRHTAGGNGMTHGAMTGVVGESYADTGGASRFYYVAKADSSERVKVNGIAHPTVKPLTLMRWLVRLVTPPGGTVLEPFAGSGTTVEACILEGFRCVAIERDEAYLPLIRQRINRRRNPVEAVKGSGGDGGLFDLLGDGAA